MCKSYGFSKYRPCGKEGDKVDICVALVGRLCGCESKHMFLPKGEFVALEILPNDTVAAWCCKETANETLFMNAFSNKSKIKLKKTRVSFFPC